MSKKNLSLTSTKSWKTPNGSLTTLSPNKPLERYNTATMIRRYFRRHPVRTQRALEILPGVFSWSLILFPFWGSFFIPTAVAYYVITFAVYWLYRSITMAVLSVMAHLRIKAASRFDWITDLKHRFPQQWHQIQHLG